MKFTLKLGRICKKALGNDWRAKIRNSDFSWVNFSGTNFSGTDFSGANFSEANFYRADFSGANFSGANFSRADFSGANFSRADFSRANFSWVNFSWVNFFGTDFFGTDFFGTNFWKAKMLKKMKLPANVATPLFVAEVGSRNDTLWFNGIIYTTGCFTGTKQELLEKAKEDGLEKFEIYKKAIEQIEKQLFKETKK